MGVHAIQFIILLCTIEPLPLCVNFYPTQDEYKHQQVSVYHHDSLLVNNWFTDAERRA